jgi:hypothetical protein
MANERNPDKPTLYPGEEICDEATGERYRVRELIGEGGMGRVFKSEHVGTGEVVAVKCNQAIDAGNAELVTRMGREGGLLKTLRHRHIVPVLATGMRSDGVTWMIMPLLDGASVGGLLSVLGRVPLVWALGITRAVCLALELAHRYAIHRDIKPENVFVTRDGRILLLDFGAGKFYAVGRFTTTGTTLGTIPYMSPEQLNDPDHIDARSDLFSAGVMLFEMLAGKHPFGTDGPLGKHPMNIGHRILEEPPRALASLAPSLPRYMTELVEKFLQKPREQRHRNAGEAAKVLGIALAELQSRHGEAPPIERMFDGYDDLLRTHARAAAAALETEKARAAEQRSAPPPAFGTEPLVAYEPPPGARGATIPLAAFHSVSWSPESALPVPGGTAPLDAAARASMGESAAVAPVSAVAPGPASEPAVPDPAAAVPSENEAPAAETTSLEEDEEAELDRRFQALQVLVADATPETREVLLCVLRDDDDHPFVRAGAAIALKSVGDETCLADLESLAATEPRPMVRRAAQEAAVAILLRMGRTLEPLAFLPSEKTAAAAPAGQEGGPAGSGLAPAEPGSEGVARRRLSWPTMVALGIACGLAFAFLVVVVLPVLWRMSPR